MLTSGNRVSATSETTLPFASYSRNFPPSSFADPFVPSFDASVAALVERGLPTFASCFPFAKHGFTNPAQALNSADAFAYDAVAAEAAWRRAEEELERLL